MSTVKIPHCTATRSGLWTAAEMNQAATVATASQRSSRRPTSRARAQTASMATTAIWVGRIEKKSEKN
jgi:hypothetical protein